MWVGVVPTGPTGHALNSSYNTRDSEGYKRDLGLALANWARVVPDGLLVFFPSYRVLEMCVSFWKGAANATASAREFRGTLWDDITRTKQAVIEPKVRGIPREDITCAKSSHAWGRFSCTTQF